ncbi:MAG: helix-turn-helix domain-containing protein [Cyanobium sp.]
MQTLTAREIQQRFDSLTLPLANIRTAAASAIQDLPPEARQAVNSQQVISTIRDSGGCSQMPLLSIGALTCLIGRTTPARLLLEPDAQISISLVYTGRSSFAFGGRIHILNPGEALIYRNQSGLQRISFGSGIGFQLQPERLRSTLRSMSGLEDLDLPDDALLSQLTPQQCVPFRTIFQLVDQLLLEASCLPQALGIDEQLYRLLAVQLLRRMDLSEQLRAHNTGIIPPRKVLDRLIDTIAARAHTPLTLTDLEACSGYSAWRLQQLFRQHFDCTPMQYVRRQRLIRARQELEQRAADTTITELARRFGYRHASHFCADFR